MSTCTCFEEDADGKVMHADGCLNTAIEKRRNDPEYQERLQRHLDENRAVLDRLAEDD